MSDYYRVFRAGDIVYFIENRWMALCRIKKIIRDSSNPDYTEYVLEILKLPYNNEHFRPLNTLRKSFSVSEVSGLYHSGMWYLYNQEQFEKIYGDLQIIMITWARYVTPLIILIIVLVLMCILVMSGCYALFSSLFLLK